MSVTVNYGGSRANLNGGAQSAAGSGKAASTAFDDAGARNAITSDENVSSNKLDEDERRTAEEQARWKALEKRLRTAETVADMLIIASSGQPLEAVLQGMVERCSETLGSQAAAVYCAEQRWDRLELVAAHGAAAAGGAAGESPVGRAILSKALAKRCGVAIGDLWREPGAPGDRLGRPSLTGYRALLVTPVERSERFYGYLVHFYAEPRLFDEDDLALARTFAQQVTLALDNAEWRSRAEKAAVENERSRLARELHDAVTQTLFSTSVVAEALPRVWERDREEGRRALDDLRLWTRGALAEMRALLMELRPAALIEKPLADLLRQLSEAAASRLLIAVTCEATGDVEPPADVKLSVYRIAQEALNNVTKHSSASHVEIHYRAGPQGLRLAIKDDGRGFDPARRASGQMGLGIMRERARHAGARLTVRSAPGAGAEVCIEWRPRGRK
jgi:signal transduction histidine kinase